MVTAEYVRARIVEKLLITPVLGWNYVDYHTEFGECGLVIKLAGKEFDIIIRAKEISN